MIIYLGRLLPDASSNLPKAGGPRQSFVSVLLRMGFTCALPVTSEAVVSYTAFPPLPAQNAQAVYFCCTGLGVTSTGRYPASCPMKPGLSSSAAFRHLHPRLSVLLNTVSDYTIFLLLRQQKVYLHPLPKWQADHTSHFEDVRHVLSPSETTLYAFLLL